MTDTISRQAAIDALRHAQHRFTVADEWERSSGWKWSEDVIYFETAERVLAELPSAQPEPIKINIDDFNKEDLERFKKELRNAPITVLPAQPEIIRCKECKNWKDSDGVYRRGFDAESKCPLNLKKVYEGTFYCGMAERRTDE